MEKIASSIDIPFFDIGNRMGNTLYIDFLKRNEIPSNVVRGIDKFGRPWFAIKAKVSTQFGSTLFRSVKVFQTFFKRYNHIPLYMGCGNYGLNLMDTSGYVSKSQENLINELIINKTIKISKNQFIDNRLDPRVVGLSVSEFNNLPPDFECTVSIS